MKENSARNFQNILSKQYSKQKRPACAGRFNLSKHIENTPVTRPVISTDF